MINNFTIQDSSAAAGLSGAGGCLTCGYANPAGVGTCLNCGSALWLARPIEAFQPLGLRLRQPGGGEAGPAGPPAPVMVGRGNDLARLQAALAAVRQDGCSRVVLLTGQDGLGKSRLVAEFRRSLAAETPVYQGNCLAHARTTPLWVVGQLLRDLLGLADSAPPGQQQQALQVYLERHGLAPTEIQPYLAHLLGLIEPGSALGARLDSLDAGILQRQTHAALRLALAAAARQAPTVLIFEDLHWLDGASQEFLAYLLRTTREAALLIILVLGEADGDSGSAALLREARSDPERVIELSLAALPVAEAHALANQLIPQHGLEAQAIKQQIISRAGGNPFYLEEIIRFLIDQKGLVRRPADGTWLVTPRAGELLGVIPWTIKGLIVARFDRLPESLRWLLQKAAVLGSHFPVSLLRPLLKTNPDHLGHQLDQLEARQFLAARPFRSQPGYAFCHTLVQETIYQTLLKRDRGSIHLQAAGVIEQSTLWLPEEQAEVLAYHYSESAAPAKAVPYLLLAADHAARRCAYATALGHYRQAWELLPEEPAGREFFQVQLGLGDMLKHLGELAAAEDVLLETFEELQRRRAATGLGPLQPLLVECLWQLADVCQRGDHYQASLDYLAAGLRIMAETGQPVGGDGGGGTPWELLGTRGNSWELEGI